MMFLLYLLYYYVNMVNVYSRYLPISFDDGTLLAKTE
jgi:hypothetical protein